MRNLPFCLLMAAGAAFAAAGESRLLTVSPRCVELRLFDVTPDGKSVAYAGKLVKDGDTCFGVWRDTGLVTTCDSVVMFEFSPAGKLAYGTIVGKSQRVTFDVGRTKDYDEIRWRSLTFSPDGNRLAWAALRQGKWRIVVNSEEGREHAGVGLPSFASDGREPVYAAQDEKWFPVVGSKEGTQYKCDWLGWLKTGKSGKLAYIVAAQEKAWVVEGKRAGSRYDNVGWPVFFPNSDKLVHTAKSKGKWFLVRDGYPLRERFDAIDYPVFSPDGRRLACVVRDGAQEFMLTSRRGRKFDQVVLPRFSPDGKDLGALVRLGGRWAVAVNDVPGKLYEEVAALVFSPKGRNYAYRARIGSRYCVVLNRSEGRQYDEITRLQFRADGKSLSYAARQERDILLVTTALP